MNEIQIRKKYLLLKDTFNERTRRLFAAAEAHSLGQGGIAIVSRATGLERHTIARGINELFQDKKLPVDRIRKDGAGRKKTTLKDKTLKTDLEKLIESTTRGDPESRLKWTTKSLRNLSKELKKKHKTSHRMIAELLHEMNYSLQSNKKTNEGSNHPDRNAQFENINQKVKEQQRKDDPAISVDAKKKELVGNFKNQGREWHPKGKPEEVQVHDFMIKKLGKVCPYGVYDIIKNKGWVNVGIDHDTASFAVESIRQWWNSMGKKEYQKAGTILITADAGGSNGVRNRLWKWELQKLANEIKKPISVSHFPPGTSKWNKIEHRLFSFISKNWRAKPLTCHKIIVNLISSTTTETGLKVKCRLNKKKYPKGIKISDQQLLKINIKRDNLMGDWNYTIFPSSLNKN
ncbi:MAG: ISAzo13 family transposase [Nanoarchaeota archaeon]